MIQDSRIKVSTTIKEFTDLKAWQDGHKLVILIYGSTKSFPKEETYSLTDQIRRSASSITNNLAEGFGRHSYKEKLQFYYLSQGSLSELKNQLLIARDVGYLSPDKYLELSAQANQTHKLLQGLIKSTKKFLNLKS